MKRTLLMLAAVSCSTFAFANETAPRDISFTYTDGEVVKALSTIDTTSVDIISRRLSGDIAESIRVQYKNVSPQFEYPILGLKNGVDFQLNGKGGLIVSPEKEGQALKGHIDLSYKVTCIQDGKPGAFYQNAISAQSKPAHIYTVISKNDISETYKNLIEFTAKTIINNKAVVGLLNSCDRHSSFLHEMPNP